MINDKKIKTLIYQYQLTQNIFTLDNIKKELSQFIFEFPMKSYQQSEDISGDFLVLILDELPQILLQYKISEVLFYTWFLIVLRNKYYNFIKQQEKTTIKTIPLIKENKNFLQDLSDKYQFLKWNEQKLTRATSSQSLVDYLNQNLTENQKKILVVLFSDLDFDFFKKEKLVHKKKLFADYMRERSKIVEKRNRLLLRMRNVYNYLIQLEKNTTYSFQIRQKQKVLRKYEKAFNRLKLNIPYSLVSKILGVSHQTIKNTITKTRKEIIQFYERRTEHEAS